MYQAIILAQNIFIDHAVRSVSHTRTRMICVTGVQNFDLHSYCPVEVSAAHQLGRFRRVRRAVPCVPR